MAYPTTIKAESIRAQAAEQALSDRIAKLETPVPSPEPVPVPTPAPAPQPTTGLVGFGQGVTGANGAALPTVLPVTTRDELVAALQRSDVLVQGDFSPIDLTAQTYIRGRNVTLRNVSLTGHTLYLADGATNVLIDNVRHRGGWAGGQDADCITVARGCTMIALRNVSVSGYFDEGVDFWDSNSDITLQDFIIGPGGDSAHSYANLFGKHTKRVTVFRGLYYGTEYRNPAVGWDDSTDSPAPEIVADIANIVTKGTKYGVTVYHGGKANIVQSVIEPGYDIGSNGAAYRSGNVTGSGAALADGGVRLPAPTLPVVTGKAAIIAAVKQYAGAFPRDALDTGWLGSL